MSKKDIKNEKTTIKGVFEVLEKYFEDHQEGMTFEVIGLVHEIKIPSDKAIYLTLKSMRKSHTGKNVFAKYNLTSFDKDMMEIIKSYNEGDLVHVNGYIASQYYSNTEKFYITPVVTKIEKIKKDDE